MRWWWWWLGLRGARCTHACHTHAAERLKRLQGGRAFRRYISDNVHKQGAGAHTLLAAVEQVPEDIRRGTALSDNPKTPYPYGKHSPDSVWSEEVPAGVQQG